jgi:[protein-PII] uridylyltransferase
VSIRPDEKGAFHVLEIVCADRLGLLSSLAQLFLRCGVSVNCAKITTLGERAMDVFLIRQASAERGLNAENLEREALAVVSA